MSSKDGGAAFPLGGSAVRGRNEGMSLRDWFAGMAMQALIQREGDYARTASRAYEIADDMLNEREK